MQCERVNEATNSMAKVVDQASQRVASMELPSDHLNKQLTAFGQELEKVVKRLGAIVDDVGVSAGVRRKRRWFRREKEEDRS